MGDTTYESSESFSVQLSSVTGASVADGTASGVINNDDPYYPY
jgi:chitinase